MPRELFGEVVRRTQTIGSRSGYTVPLSVVVHAAVVAVLVVVPLMAVDVLPVPPALQRFDFMPVAPLPTPPPAPVRSAVARTMPDPSASAAPVEAPREIRPETGLVVEPEGRGVDGGLDNPVPGSTFDSLPDALPPPPPPVPVAPVRPGGNVRPPTRVSYQAPDYPSVAQQARVEGTVILEAVIGTDGRVRDVRVLRSIPLLDQAAVDAVRKWVYTPTLLNGVPMPIVMTVTVTFSLR
jgi:periplasmic protein TonB